MTTEKEFTTKISIDTGKVSNSLIKILMSMDYETKNFNRQERIMLYEGLMLVFENYCIQD